VPTLEVSVVLKPLQTDVDDGLIPATGILLTINTLLAVAVQLLEVIVTV
jgi:hypothetical protein